MIRVGWFVRFGLVCALLVELLPVAFSGPVAHAQSSAQAGSWYRYQGEPSSYDEFDNQQVNCGPTAVASAIQYSLNLSVPIKDIRALIGKNKAWTHYSDLTRALSKWNVKYAENIRNVDDLRGVVDRGNVAIVGADMRKISPGADVNGASTDPSIRIGRYETTATDHWFVVKGVSADGKYFIVYDGNVWSGPGTAKYWYSDGTPKGLDRYYLVSEVAAAMGRLAPNVVKGVEITSGSRPNVEQGQSVDATVTYYTASFEETQKRPGDPGWGAAAAEGTLGRGRGGPRVHTAGHKAEDLDGATRCSRPGYGFGRKGLASRCVLDRHTPGRPQKNDEMGGYARSRCSATDRPLWTGRRHGAERPVVRIDGEGTSLSRFVKLQLSATEAPNNPTGMMISNSAHFTDAFEEPFAPEKEWTLTPGDGPQTVYVRFKNSSGAWSEVGTAGIDLQERPPVGSVTVAPDPQLLLSARLSGNALPSLGPQPKTTGQPLYRPLGPNLLANSSFESWAGGIPASWDSELRD
ncbi:MAG: C39 family peptidase, partial [Chloroflexia bacterium]